MVENFYIHFGEFLQNGSCIAWSNVVELWDLSYRLAIVHDYMTLLTSPNFKKLIDYSCNQPPNSDLSLLRV